MASTMTSYCGPQRDACDADSSCNAWGVDLANEFGESCYDQHACDDYSSSLEGSKVDCDLMLEQMCCQIATDDDGANNPLLGVLDGTWPNSSV